jgi:hypothetical protein
VKPTDDEWPPLPAPRALQFLDWLEAQIERHYAQRREMVLAQRTELAYGLKLEAHTYERVRTAFLDVLAGQTPERVPPRHRG